MTYSDFLLVFLGGVGLMTLYMGAQALVTADRSYWYYTLYAGCWICFFVFKVQYSFDDQRVEAVVYAFSRIGFPMLGYVCYYRFAETFLDTRQTLPGVFRLFRRMQIGLLTYVGLELLVCLFRVEWTQAPAHEGVHSVVRLAVAVASLAGIRQALRRPDAVTGYFVVGSVFLLIGALMAMIFSMLSSDSPVVRAWNEPLFWLNLGIVAELLCFSLGLSYKHKRTEIQKLTVEQEVLREREQRQTEQLKMQFFTNISHEFRTPLTLILGPLTDLLRQQPQHTAYQLMHRNASRLLALVNQLLDLSRLDAGQLRPAVQPGPLTDWLRMLTGSFVSLADSRDIRLTFGTDTTAFEMAWFDRDKTEKIVTNLLANALKFTPAGGAVTLTLAAEADGRATIRVQDTGPGIPPGEQARIFERFHQVPGRDTAGVAEGTGIGLALVRELVAVLRGTVTVANAPGQGAVFSVTLPVDAGTWAAAVRPDEPVLGQSVPMPATLDNADFDQQTTDNQLIELENQPLSLAEKPVLLLVEDNADMRQYIGQVLAGEFRIVEARDGREGLQQAKIIPDIVVCDWMMAGMDGMAFCRALKSQPATDHIPIIMLTAKATTANRIEGFGRGADDYLTKPVHPDELRARVRNLLLQRQKLRAHFGRELRLHPSPVAVLSVEEQFLQRAIGVVEQQIGNSAFSIDQLADALSMSRMQLHRKLRALTNQSATEFVRHLRLQRAADLLRQRAATVSEVAFGVGFESLSYFSKAFKDQFGVLPSAYGTGAGAGVT